MTRLIDVLWGDHPPATATKALQVYVSQLRRTLGGERDRDPLVGLRDRPRAGAARPRPLFRDAGRARRDGATGRSWWRSCARRWPCSADRRWSTRRCSDRRPPRRTGSTSCGMIALERRIEADLTLGRARGAGGRAGGADRRAPVSRALPRTADAGALSRRSPGRCAGRVPPGAHGPGRRARAGPGPELQQLEAAILAQDPALDLTAAPPPRSRARGAAAARTAPARCSAATRIWPRRTALLDDDAPAHADRAGRDRQDAVRARARAPPRRDLRATAPG